METFFQALVPALAVGSLYALIALGYTMVYGILKFINFAHSDIFVLGAWVSLTAAWCAGYAQDDGAGTPIAEWVLAAIGAAFALGVLVWAIDRFVRPSMSMRWAARLPTGKQAATLGLVGGWGGVCVGLVLLARAMHGRLPEGVQFLTGGLILIIAMLVCGLVGFVLERLAYKPLRSAPRLNVLITAIGVSLLLQNLGQLPWMFSTRPQRMPELIEQSTALFHISGVGVGWVDVLGAGTAVVLMVGLDWLVYRTKLGSAMRAVSFNPAHAALMGIPVDRVISFTFVLGAMLAAAAGFLYAQKYPGLGQTAAPIWVLLGLKAFVAAVIGGIGNIRGAMVGGLLIGLLEFFGRTYISTKVADVYVFGLLIVVLLVKPTGLFGAPDREKV